MIEEPKFSLYSDEQLRETQLYVIRQLAANCLRVCRGSGEPGHIVGMSQYISEIQQEIERRNCSKIGEQAIRDNLDVRASGHANESDDKSATLAAWQDHCLYQIICGALQVAGSRILEQRTQESIGEKEMMYGIAEYQEVREQLSQLRR